MPDDSKILKKMLDKLNDLSADYRDAVTLSESVITPECTQKLIDFVHYRDDFIDVQYKLLMMGVLDSKTSWMMTCYCAYVTNGLKIFNCGSTSKFDKKFMRELKEWRNFFDDE